METKKILKCASCGAVVEVLTPCNCPCGIDCCDGKMVEMTAKTADSAMEKHVPVAEKAEGGTKVLVGSVPHPMTAEHFIQWIEIVNGSYVNRKYLKPGEKPEASFYVELKPGMILREYCSVHGLWEKKIG